MRIRRDGRSPLSHQLEDILKEQIAQGVYGPGDMLPSETELIRLHSVSRTTVRSAMQWLCQQGLAYTIHGKGTFVAAPRITDNLPSLTSFSHDVAQGGMRPSRRVLRLEVVQADKEISAKLRIPPSSLVLHFDRLLLAEDDPISIGYTYIPLTVITPFQDSFTESALEKGSLYAIFERIGIHLRGGEQTISAVAATPEQAKLLKVKRGSPLVYAERVANSIEHERVEYTEIVSRPDRIQWKVHLNSPDLST